MEAERLYWWALSLAPGIGVRRFYKLLEEYGSVQNIWECKPADLQTILPARIRKEFVEFRVNFDPEPRLKALQERGISLITLLDADYPNNLKDIIDPPPVLYILGQLKPRDSRSIAVVGSRRATPYGRATAERFGRELAELGFTVISGMARGIDTCAHRGCLAAGGRTIAVLGCGLDYVYPPENRTLMAKIAREGAVVTEFPLGTPPEAGHFPVRNRIISGLSQGVLVVEATATSGSLITVDWALEQGRDVFAVPGNINSPYSKGTNYLISQGARLVQGAQEIAAELKVPVEQGGSGAETVNLSSEEKKVLTVFQDRHLHIDEIIRATRLAPQQVVSILLMLELKGCVQQLPGKLFVKSG
ncbi:MAG TPA: DNA-protecting protein DprA [Firmicutes bacterium]|jgi:DNA processing protein|nr:DNA-protecting protein DprA [Bacillota bacterium]